ncbi:MAG: carcinine hydrolase/isopenicillin-N N-acyltransferase family protein [Thermodesulfobacteriota bacterium]
MSGQVKRFFLKIWAVCLLICFSLVQLHHEARACTLWAAGGSRAEGGGVILAKNRDMPPNHRQELRLVRPPGGYRYFGLFARRGDEAGLRAGVNEKGLVMVDAAASCIPKGERRRPMVRHLNEKILAACADVDAVLRRQLMFIGPAYYLIADPRRAVILEVGLDGARSVTGFTQGVLAHTNHYLNLGLAENNCKVKPGSQVRLERIRELLDRRPRPLTLEDFIAMSEDRQDGPDHSIWRRGSTRKKTRTLASWIISLPHHGPPSLYVKLANPGEPPVAHRFRLDPAFWSQASGLLGE